MIANHEILFISFFLYFIIVRKSVRTFTNEFTIFGGNNTLTLVAAKKCIFSFRRNWPKGPWYGLVHFQQSYSPVVNIQV